MGTAFSHLLLLFRTTISESRQYQVREERYGKKPKGKKIASLTNRRYPRLQKQPFPTPDSRLLFFLLLIVIGWPAGDCPVTSMQAFQNRFGVSTCGELRTGGDKTGPRAHQSLHPWALEVLYRIFRSTNGY